MPVGMVVAWTRSLLATRRAGGVWLSAFLAATMSWSGSAPASTTAPKGSTASATAAAPAASAASSSGPSLDEIRAHYPAASLTPRSQPGWEKLSNRVEAAAPGDEAASGSRSPNGSTLYRRIKMCFPTEMRNLFSEVDQVVGPDGALRPIDYFNGTVVPDDARSAIRGQNTWMLWGEGNDAFWGWLQENGYGIADFLILIDSRQRAARFKEAGLINQPGLRAQKEPGKRILGLYLDQADGDKVKLPQPANDIDAKTGKLAEVIKPPPSHQGAAYKEFFRIGDQKLYDETVKQMPDDGIDPLIYGYASGVVGLRLMLNPDFFGDSAAASQARSYWNERVLNSPTPDAYYTDDTIRADPKLVRPFRISMACAFCHVGPHPLNPPADPANPGWANMSSVIGSQYWTPDKAFSNLKKPNSFLWQFVASQQPGTIDTSLVSTDHINNANTITAIFEINPRLARAKENPPEQQSAANLRQRGIEDAPNFQTNPRHTPRVLLDGADSIGVEGALSRVYLNIGTYSEQWRHLHNPVIGFKPQRPFELATIQDKSVYWQATEAFRIPQLESFFTYVSPRTGVTSTQAMKLSATADGKVRLAAHAADVNPGRQVFIQHCAVCHSSKQPAQQQWGFSRDWRAAAAPAGAASAAAGGIRPAALTLPMDFAEWDAFKASPAYLAYVKRLEAFLADEQAQGRDFLKDNYLSNDIRVPITLVGTNSGRSMGTNGMRGQVWDNFSSDTYKALPAVGVVRFYNPLLAAETGVDRWGNNDSYVPPAGGPGYYRPASLASLWTAAPLLHNNALGLYNGDPSIKGRLAAFDDAIDKLLWPERRASGSGRPGDMRHRLPSLANEPGFIYRTTERSWIDFRAPFIRPLVEGVAGKGLTAFLTGWLWWLAALLAIVLVLVGRARLAGFALTVFAALFAALLRASAIDTILPWLWLIPAVALAGGVWFLVQQHARTAARVVFGLSAVAFLAIGGVATAFVDGRVADIRLGPIPTGTPVNLLMNINPEAPPLDLFHAVAGLVRGMLRVQKEELTDDKGAALDAFLQEAGKPLLKASKCPDFVLDRGHWFAQSLTDEEKRQLKAFLETL
ncbi:hypothetical protein SAMN05216359_12011 [Roseateles sp. YR242]|uniref:hypothetical protein n=1 Tax=Roseateles sp. YR242 TaxID=1855305 RepID=UPI0008C91D78|nr:hypothetical protein [Roseateles sp. YR242]SEL85829.1 hypothetical protein SAMN05216359_12011 [Roseateles sp. YR242]